MSKQIKFDFQHSALTANDNITVVKFNGDEGISKLFEFTIELKSSNADLDIDAILESPASLEITLGDDTRKIQGIVSHFDAVRQINNDTIYVATLVPRLWELSLYHTNEVYLEQTVSEIIETVLQEAGFTSLDYDISGIEDNDVTSKVWPYKCQYGETHLDFISRLMERDGIYYYFVEGDVGEKVVFCNSLNFQEAIATPDVLYSPVSSLEINALENTVNSFVSQQKRLPYKVLVKDYNDDKPSVDIKGEAVIDDKANKASEIYVWGQNIESPEEGGVLAQIRAEEFLAGKRTYHGESSVVRLLTGFNFNLKEHFRQSCNQEYLLLSVSHEGSNPSALDFSGGIENLAPVYSNTFSAIAADVQYRPAQETNKPEIHGTLNAFVDSEGDGQYAEVDEEGRYRVTLPFDRVDRDGGKASHWLRMSQPFSGENQGMHFPLRKGAEVLLTFIGGDPDRPVIAGSIPNASQPSVVNADNQTNSMIKTGAGNKIELEDKDGKNRIKLQTGDDKTYFHIGAPNHPGDGVVTMSKGMERKEIIGGQQILIAASGAEYEDVNSKKRKIRDRVEAEKLQEDVNEAREDWKANKKDPALTAKLREAEEKAKAGVGETSGDVFTEQDAFTFVLKDEKGVGQKKITKEMELEGKHLFERRIGDKYIWTAGNEYIYGADNVYDFGNCWDEAHANENGIDDNKESFAIPTFKNALGSVATAEGKSIDWSNEKRGLDPENQLVEQIWGDQYSYHHGRRFDWCSDPADYNFGNGYTENLIKSNTETINADYDKDKAGDGGPKFGTITSKHYKFEMAAGATAVSKDIGDTYSFAYGNTVEVRDGKSESEQYGDSYSYVDGNTYDVVEGNTYSRHWGRSDNFFMGGTSTFGLSGNFSLEAAANLAIFAGTKTEISLINSNSLFAGLSTDLVAGARIEIKLGAKCELNSAADVKTKVSDIKAALNDLSSAASSLNANSTRLETVGAYLKSAGAHISTGVVTLFS